MTDNSEQWCRTTSGETTETKFTWKIEDFKNRPEKVGKDIQSSIFLSKNPDKKTSSWKLCLYPNGAKESENNHFSIFLESCNDFPVKAKYCVSILDASSKKTHAWDCSTDVYNAVVAGKSAWGNGQWALRESIINNPELLPGGHLTIVCELTVYGTEETLSGSKDVELKSKTKTYARGLEQVIEHLGKLFNDKEFSDVEIKCDGEIFNCHQAILSTRSDIFRAMFQADMTESLTKKVDIKDIDSEVVRELLHFIYTGSVNENVLKEKARELLAAADMYQLDVLKNICEDHLCSNIQINNAVENLVFGDLNQASKLRSRALRVIAGNLVEVVKTEEYQNLVKHHPSLAAEIPMALVDDKMK